MVSSHLLSHLVSRGAAHWHTADYLLVSSQWSHFVSVSCCQSCFLCLLECLFVFCTVSLASVLSLCLLYCLFVFCTVSLSSVLSLCLLYCRFVFCTVSLSSVLSLCLLYCLFVFCTVSLSSVLSLCLLYCRFVFCQNCTVQFCTYLHIIVWKLVYILSLKLKEKPLYFQGDNFFNAQFLS